RIDPHEIEQRGAARTELAPGGVEEPNPERARHARTAVDCRAASEAHEDAMGPAIERGQDEFPRPGRRRPQWVAPRLRDEREPRDARGFDNREPTVFRVE